MPLVEAGITEPEAYKMCEELGCLAPTYQTGARDGCWFCHNQGVDQLRRLFRDYPELWARLLPLDDDSPTKFKPNGCTLRDYDARFKAERERASFYRRTRGSGASSARREQPSRSESPRSRR